MDTKSATYFPSDPLAQKKNKTKASQQIPFVR